ncbi:helix-turn-helix transcriptional regulator [Pedobacter foliorum]|uniref:helix-turn-helix domain-containing protein n=1 Tax=Pedobacter foliorum TaxID=2739058 RepID=UPI0015633DEF|nr:helix-turn-helix transcriptional regulator [Pedobacter foliorum]NRF37269.1 helix-turn-helix transcriptional regulator [Pedobacter foliorum]
MKNPRRHIKSRFLNENIDLEEYKEQLRSIRLAIAIRNVLDLRNISVAEFAAIMGKDRSTINKWLSGTYCFSLSTLYEITEGLGIL